MLNGCCLLRYTLYAASALVLMLACAQAAGANSYANLNMYGFPLIVGPGGTGAAGVPGDAYTFTSAGLGIPEVTSRYGMISASSVSRSPEPSFYGYLGPDWNGIQLGVNFGFPSASRDFATTAFAKDLAYEATLDNACIGFPGIGVGSLGVGFPSVTSNRANVKYAESVKFQLTTESNTLALGGFGFPLGLGLGYCGVGVNGGIGMTSGGLGLPFYYGY